MTVEKIKKRNAIILAAGMGMRMTPIGNVIPKGLLEVYGEVLIERMIQQLHEVNIYDIYIVVGFKAEMFSYLIEKYGVQLIINTQYAELNNLHSLYLVREYIDNTYIIPSDIWCFNNQFSIDEETAWYMCWNVSDSSQISNMVGITYLTEEYTKEAKNKLVEYDGLLRYNDAFWEEVLYKDGVMNIPKKYVNKDEVIEINTYEQLRELDSSSYHLKSEVMEIIADTLQSSQAKIRDIIILKKGMTNRSFLFSCKNKKYIMRIPGEGTDLLINRRNEANVYKQLSGKSICDDVLYLNPDNGYKLTEYWDNSRNCNAKDEKDLHKCLTKLKEFHQLKLSVEHEFNLFNQIEFYEKLREGIPSEYEDYKETKEHVFLLKSYISRYAEEKCLTHIDAVADNFLILQDGSVRLIDWEYAGMQDPHVDIAMFCIYSMYENNEVDRVIDIYFEGECQHNIRVKIYCYIAVCGLLWSNWCEYKKCLGISFGEYASKQYAYAKEYYDLVKQEVGVMIDECC